jgi:hypothetical protein
MNRQGSVSLFSLLSFSQKDRRFPRAQVCRGDGMKTWTKHCSRTSLLAGKRTVARSCRKEINYKAKLPKFEQSIFLLLRLLSLNNSSPCMENLHAMEPSQSWLRPHFVSSPLNNLNGCTNCDKVACRQRHRQQATEVPHPVLMAKVHAPASSQKA